MFYYQLLVDKNLPRPYLIYSCDKDLQVGQIVEINVRNQLTWGAIFAKISDPKIEINTIKSITNTLPFVFSLNQLKFLQTFAKNTFNSPNSVLHSMLKPLKLLTKKDLQNLETK